MLKKKSNHPVRCKLKIKKGDIVEIISGKDKGQRGRVIEVMTQKQKVVLEGLTKDKEGKATPLNAMTKHRKPRNPQDQGERLRLPAPLHVSKVMLVDPHSDKKTRVGRRIEDGEIVRFAKASGETIEVK